MRKGDLQPLGRRHRGAVIRKLLSVNFKSYDMRQSRAKAGWKVTSGNILYNKFALGLLKFKHDVGSKSK